MTRSNTARSKVAAISRAASDEYTSAQQMAVGLWLFDIWDGAGFGALYDGEERRYMPRLLVGSCIASLKQKPLSVTDAYIVMDAKHGRTAAKYIGLAVEQGLVKKIPDPDGDARKTVLVPTEQLQQKFADEIARVADDARDLVAALRLDPAGLPVTGAAEIMVRSQDYKSNRHSLRAEANPPFPPRNWTTAYFGAK